MTIEDAGPARIFALRALVRRVLDESSAPDPGSIAALVLEQISEKNLRAALAVTLPDYVRHVMGSERQVSFGFPPSAPETVQTPVQTQETNAPAYHSRRTSLRQSYSREMRQRLHVGPTAKDYKMFGLCGIPDLTFAVAERRDTAARTLAMAEWYGQVIERPEKHDVACVQELPPSVLAELFGVRP